MRSAYKFKSSAKPCNFFRESSGINYTKWNISFFNIVALFADDSNFSINKCYIGFENLFIEGKSRGKVCELMLRLPEGEKDPIVVARVEFMHKRCGNMSKLYMLLKRIQKKFKLGPIIIESVSSEAMRNWCQKNGFTRIKTNDSPEEEMCRIANYIEPI